MKPVGYIITCLALILFPGCRPDPHTEIKMNDQGNEFIPITSEEELSSFSGRMISFEGKVSDIPWQHLIKIPETHPHISYVDTEGHGQVVVYSRDRITCRGPVKIQGTVFKVEGKSKRPGSDDLFTEYQIMAEKWKCI